MKHVFKVDYLRIWKSLTLFMSFSVIIPVGIYMIYRLVTGGIEYAFEHISIKESVLLLIGLLLFIALFAFLIALYIKRATIIIENDKISGLNFWGRRKSIPLNQINQLSDYNNQGIEAKVIHSENYGSIYISLQTIEIEKLLEFIELFINQNNLNKSIKVNSNNN